MHRQAIDLDQQCRPKEPEVRAEASPTDGELRLEQDRPDVVVAQQARHERLEHALGTLIAEGPLVEHPAEDTGTAAAASAQLVERRAEAGNRDEVAHQRLVDGRLDLTSRQHRPEVDQGPRRPGDPHAPPLDAVLVAEVGRTVQHHPAGSPATGGRAP